MKFQAKKFLEAKFHDSEKLRDFLAVYGHEVKPMTAYNWFRRDTLPTKWAFTLLALLETEQGKPVSLREFLA
jgi:hypothetical protein